MLTLILNGLVKVLGVLLQAIFTILPNSPFKALDNSPIASYLPGINYFIPISDMLSVGEAWLAAIGVYYIYQAALRWVKMED